MDATVVGIIVFTCTFVGALFGMWLRTALPEHWLDAESRDTVKVGVGLIATMTALVLGLVTASTKSSFDAVDTAVKQTGSSTPRSRPRTCSLRVADRRDSQGLAARGWGANRHDLGAGLIQASRSGPAALGRRVGQLSDSRTQSGV